MANKPNSQNSSAKNAPWRSGRPSFKAFYPEIFLLTLVTIGFIALAINLSCHAIRGAKPASAAAIPAPVRVDAPLLTPFAFANEVSLDDVLVPENEQSPDGGYADDDAKETAVAEENADPVAGYVDQNPVADKDRGKAEKESVMTKILWYWIICLFIPAVLWIWRGILWIYAVWGVYYELRVDPDNPRETTFLTTRGIFNKTTDSLHIGSIKDIRCKQTFFQKHFMGGVGTVTLFTKDLTDARVDMKNMSEPSRVFNAFDELKRHYWGRGGMQLHAGGEEDGSFDNSLN